MFSLCTDLYLDTGPAGPLMGWLSNELKANNAYCSRILTLAGHASM